MTTWHSHAASLRIVLTPIDATSTRVALVDPVSRKGYSAIAAPGCEDAAKPLLYQMAKSDWMFSPAAPVPIPVGFSYRCAIYAALVTSLVWASLSWMEPSVRAVEDIICDGKAIAGPLGVTAPMAGEYQIRIRCR